MQETNPVPFTLDMELTNYMPLPRGVLSLDLPRSAVLQYAALLDRGTLSRKNRLADEDGWVYVFYPQEELAEYLGYSTKIVQKNQRLLEDAGLIRRVHTNKDRSVRIHLSIPRESEKFPEEGTSGTGHREESSPPIPQKVHTNNISKQQKINNNYYQHNQEESL